MLTNLASLESDSFTGLDPALFGALPSGATRSGQWQTERELRLREHAKANRSALDIGPDSRVEISPVAAVTRRALAWDGVAAEIIETRDFARTDFTYNGAHHLLVVCERGVRSVGATSIDALPRSTLRDLAGKISFVPAGREFHHSQEPRTPSRFILVYFDPTKLEGRELRNPRVLFDDTMLLTASLRLAELVEMPTSSGQAYREALSSVVLHELERLNRQPTGVKQQIRGGLAAWQQRTISAFIEEHLADPISLASMAQLVRLSPFHFSRAFKQSFGQPPHRYHIARRIERAKTLLAESSRSVTEIGFEIGFSETSAFSATFRRLTGTTPTGYSRNHAWLHTTAA